MRDSERTVVGHIDLRSVTDDEHGNLVIDFEVDEDFRSYYKRVTGNKRVSKGKLAKFVRRILSNVALREPGYELVKE